MSFDLEDTIVAIASAAGGAMRGIIRLSGPDVAACLDKRFSANEDARWKTLRHASVVAGRLDLEPPISPLPCDLYFWPTGRSYTGQPCAEIHTIGSPPLLDAAVRLLCAAGARLAEPGEFTMRAFLAGRLDLTQAEAVLGVIDASSRTELDVALAQLAGGLSSPLNGLRDELLDLLAHLEAGFDFVDEDIEFISGEQLLGHLKSASAQIANIAERMADRGIVTGEQRVVFVGWPNVGKSSLLNALAGHNAAIVSHIAGTTRDYVTRGVQFHGVNCLLVDTAGVELQQPADDIAAAAQAAASRQSEQAHLQLFCLDSTRTLNDWERVQIDHESSLPRLVVLTKTDRERTCDYNGSAIETSARSGAGLDSLCRAIAETLGAASNVESGVVAGTSVRCSESLRLAASSLERAHCIVAGSLGEELVAAEVRLALDELGKVVGAVYTDEVLDRIFSRICMGK